MADLLRSLIRPRSSYESFHSANEHVDSSPQYSRGTMFFTPAPPLPPAPASNTPAYIQSSPPSSAHDTAFSTAPLWTAQQEPQEPWLHASRLGQISDTPLGAISTKPPPRAVSNSNAEPLGAQTRLPLALLPPNRDYETSLMPTQGGSVSTMLARTSEPLPRLPVPIDEYYAANPKSAPSDWSGPDDVGIVVCLVKACHERGIHPIFHVTGSGPFTGTLQLGDIQFKAAEGLPGKKKVKRDLAKMALEAIDGGHVLAQTEGKKAEKVEKAERMRMEQEQAEQRRAERAERTWTAQEEAEKRRAEKAARAETLKAEQAKAATERLEAAAASQVARGWWAKAFASASAQGALSQQNWIGILLEWHYALGLDIPPPVFEEKTVEPPSGLTGGPGFVCTVALAPWPQEIFGSGKAYYRNKQSAKAAAARRAVEWLIEHKHLIVSEDGHVAKLSRPSNAAPTRSLPSDSATASTQLPAAARSPPPSASETSSDGATFAQKVNFLYPVLGLMAPVYNITTSQATGSGGTDRGGWTGTAHLPGHMPHDGYMGAPVARTEGASTRKAAKEELARQTYEFLTALRAERQALLRQALLAAKPGQAVAVDVALPAHAPPPTGSQASGTRDDPMEL